MQHVVYKRVQSFVFLPDDDCMWLKPIVYYSYCESCTICCVMVIY